MPSGEELILVGAILGYCLVLQLLGMWLIWHHRSDLRTGKQNSDLEMIPSPVSLGIGMMSGMFIWGLIACMIYPGFNSNPEILSLATMIIEALFCTIGAVYTSEMIFKMLAHRIAPRVRHKIDWVFGNHCPKFLIRHCA